MVLLPNAYSMPITVFADAPNFSRGTGAMDVLIPNTATAFVGIKFGSGDTGPVGSGPLDTECVRRGYS